jgi:hypothetical protein
MIQHGHVTKIKTQSKEAVVANIIAWKFASKEEVVTKNLHQDKRCPTANSNEIVIVIWLNCQPQDYAVWEEVAVDTSYCME